MYRVRPLCWHVPTTMDCKRQELGVEAWEWGWVTTGYWKIHPPCWCQLVCHCWPSHPPDPIWWSFSLPGHPTYKRGFLVVQGYVWLLGSSCNNMKSIWQSRFPPKRVVRCPPSPHFPGLIFLNVIIVKWFSPSPFLSTQQFVTPYF